ncbi:ROK family transcriptional regulator [Enterococcus columbae]|uniref:HTH marR-type domain-containing protein n=1 Tax=Enterococcus columbae DSM 7374 = ATCC 51263 TaxID=1121865 RepID=S1NKI9_9ENTE|nr:ROK family transcriptional regulator [Enterococcus columbae]EOT41761.1 hypothetical protein OMW_01250 [Enterococcus columbae DSM 7374 = ATCC 51263]EOW80691.1 hypothetical protein I568_01869 [Enterococcus columbae DSM 7374 = ATCC 51263]OJG21939.1 hypothetical protein RR47_GL001143 [Enterococcus columbae DSM 7374 = ATCC 51263]
MISSKYTIREQNQAKLLREIIQSQEISRADLAQVTGLNKASVSEIIKDLLEQHFIFETRIGNASTVGGRKPILLTFNKCAATVISIDLGPDYIEGMFAYIDGTVICSISKKEIFICQKNVLSLLREVIETMMKKQPVTPHGIVGIALAIHGIVFENEIRFTPYYDLDQMNLQQQLSELFHLPVYLENEANLAALGEYTFISQADNLLSISVHSGIGAGIVQDGVLITGKNGEAGEIGHSILYPDGKLCPCGNHGCLEQYASHQALYKKIKEQLNLDIVNSDIVQEFYRKQHPVIQDLIHENVHLLSIGINNAIMAFSPEVIVINSSIYRKIPGLIAAIKKNLPSRFAKENIIRNTLLDDKAILYGGFALVAQAFLNIQNLKLTLEQAQ